MTEQPKRIPWTGPDFAMVGGGIAMAVGPFLPYLSASGFGIGSVDRNGMDLFGAEIFIVIAAGLGIAFLAWNRVQNGTAATWLPVILGLVAAAITAYYYVQIDERVKELSDNEFGFGSIGVGLWLTAAGVAVALVGSLLSRSAHKATPVSATPPSP